jgi:Protein of unknown function (DUF1706)
MGSMSIGRIITAFTAILKGEVEQILESMTDEQINKPQDWLGGGSVLSYITGDTVEHYEEHSRIIQTWLNREVRA